MKNLKIIQNENLIHNINQFKSKQICAMVKSNAYGHGIKEIVKQIEDVVDLFGVVSVEEAKLVRNLTEKRILICAKTEEFSICKKNNFELIVDDELSLKNAVKSGLGESLHLKINCGMNRFGIKSTLNAKMINDFLETQKINLKSICTHFPYTQNKFSTQKHYESFLRIRSEITQNAPNCFGGSGIIKYPFEFDIIRLGIGMYGYGQKNLKPVMKIQSYVSKIFHTKKGDFVGYGKKYKSPCNATFAIVPVGYGDGLRRNLSGNFSVKINNKKFSSVGNICMDCFFVKVDETVKVGDSVEVLSNAEKFAKISNTISYEILTGFSTLRGQTMIN